MHIANCEGNFKPSLHTAKSIYYVRPVGPVVGVLICLLLIQCNSLQKHSFTFSIFYLVSISLATLRKCSVLKPVFSLGNRTL